ncbi:phospholipid-binding protein MlaC [Sodalis-like secondary symbiont of Drepanosiphum platanoidis]|uniref:phospholipid-binding protein MlaC n=1 Tax=Sodalis-like secondary symbiont of Drepanosiphum platanoidis TaxID=2994493 RepID=UPI0034642B6F
MFKYFLIFTIFMTTYVEAIENSNPYKLMKHIVDNTFTRLEKVQKKIHKNPKILKSIIKEELIPFVDIKYSGALVLGDMYKNYIPLQREDYFKVFQDYLENMYGKILLLYKHQFYRISSLEKPLNNSEKVSICVSILRKGKIPSINLDFQWKKNIISGDWKFYDIIIEGISIINTIKNEWKYILRHKGIEDLISHLQSSSKKPLKFRR